MGSIELSLSFDGPDVHNGEMDIKQLAPAMLALSELFEESNWVLNRYQTNIRVNVGSDFKSGSFEFFFNVYEMAARVGEWLETMRPLTPAELAGLIGVSSAGAVKVGISLIKLIKKSKGRKVERVESLGDGNVNLFFEGDNNGTVVINNVYQLFNARSVKGKLARLTKPLRDVGIEKIRSKEKGVVVEEITQNEAGYFSDTDSEDNELKRMEYDIVLTVQQVNFKKGNKWKLSDGRRTDWYAIQDEAFSSDVDEGKVSFAKGDMLDAKVLAVQKMADGKLSTEYKVIHVNRQIPRDEL